MARTVEACPFRVCVSGQGRLEVARCRLLGEVTETDWPPFPVPRDACEHCSRLAAPSPRRPNLVIASLLYALTNRIMASDGLSGAMLHGVLQIQQAAISRLEVASTQSPGAAPAEPVPEALTPRRLVDRRVTVDTFTEHLKRGEPFSHPRYGDSEWLSMLGAPGTTRGGHDYFPETTGRELRASLDYVADRYPNNRNLYVGLIASWSEPDLQAYLLNRGLTDRVRWVRCVLFQDGLRDLSTKRFLEAAKEFPGPKYLVANRWLAPIAHGLGCRHVTIPERNCYWTIDATEKACRFAGRGLVIFCASFASECLIRRLHRRNPSGTYVDCGHVFDAMAGRITRPHTKRNVDGILELLEEHYCPMFPKE